MTSNYVGSVATILGEAPSASETRPSGWFASLRRVALDRPVLVVGTTALLLRLVAVAFFAWRVRGVVIPDERQYLDLARWMSEGKPPAAYALGYGKSLLSYMPAFVWPQVWLAHVFGSGRVPGSLYVVAYGVAAAALTTVLGLRFLRPLFAVAAGLVVATVPSQVLFSSVLLREALVWAGVVAAAIGAGVALEARTWRRLLAATALLCAALILLGWLRDQTLLVAVWALPIVVALGVRQYRLWRVAGTVVLVVVIPMAAGIGPAGHTLLSKMLPQLGTVRTNLSMSAESAFTATTLLPQGAEPETAEPGTGATKRPPHSSIRSATTTTTLPGAITTTTQLPADHTVVRGYSGEQYVVDESAGASVRAAPRGLIAVLFRPFPWEGSSGSMKLAAAEDIIWYPLYAFAAVGAWVAFRRRIRVLAYPVIVGLGLVATSAITQGNLGTAFRHRGQILWIVALLASFAAQTLVDRRRSARDPR